MVALQAQNPFGHASTRTISKCSGIPQHSVARIIRGFGLHLCKISLCQQLQGGDMPKRVEFAQWILQNQPPLDRIMWSYQAYFSLDGVVNRHNCVIWAYETHTK